MRSRLISLLTATLLLSACGGGSNGAITVGTSAAPDVSFDKDLCSGFEDDNGPSDELVAGLPKRFADAVTAVKDFSSALDAMGQNDESSVDALVAALSKRGVTKELADFGEFAEQECGVTQGSTAIKGLAVAAEMASTPKDAAYCKELSTRFAGDSSGGSEQFAKLAEIAPKSHRDALRQLAELDPNTVTDADQAALFGPMFGLGIYAESVCGIDQALAQMLLGAMFMGMGDGGGSTSTTLPEGVDPAQYPDITADAANAALPAGSGLTFAVASADLEDDGNYLASVVVPSGWEPTTGFNVEFAPPASSGASIFTTVEVGAGCDGSCEATDWDARLRGESGALASYLDQHPGASEAPISGSKGVVVTDSSEVAALVLRWDDSADRYFSCEVDLETEDAALLPAFVTACESSRPAWFAVG